MDIDNNRYCPECKDWLPLSEFYKDSRGNDGLTRRCRVHHSSKSYEARKKKIASLSRSERYEYRRKLNLHKCYKMSLQDYDAMLLAQGGRCAICGEPESSTDVNGNVKLLAIDHDHSCCPGYRTCGKCIRGLICQSHNFGIGCFEDNPEILRAAADYIEKYRKVI